MTNTVQENMQATENITKDLNSLASTQATISSDFMQTMNLLQAERRATLFSSCQRLDSAFRDYTDNPSLNSMYSEKYQVSLIDYTASFTHRFQGYTKL